ncbi:MAG: flagellar hook protein FlgE [Desulfovibrionales bacterium]|nr:flagellar hook protein FlgE [Desulfovibrionales bacterium]
MSISSSIFIGTTGVTAQQENMSVISDNIANMNTVGFKSSRLLFNSLLSEQLAGADVGHQVGQGVGVSSVFTDMASGAMEKTALATDIAVGGNGFFIVSPQNSDALFYTRAGNFTFDAQGYYRDPAGNIVQGYRLTDSGAAGSTLEDIRLDAPDGNTFMSDPRATSAIRMMFNLDSSAPETHSGSTSPLTALFDEWDAAQDPPLARDSYAYTSSLRVYDSAGQAHSLTAYFDPAGVESTGADGRRVWEFLLTTPPAEDGSALSTKKGVLMAGTLTFDAVGALIDMSAFQGTTDDKSSWVPASFSGDGLPVMRAATSNAGAFTATVDFGLRNGSSGAGNTDWILPEEFTSMDNLGTTLGGLPGLASPTVDALATTSYNATASTIFQSQNGYTAGYLESVSVASDGTIVGTFSNGQDLGLFTIPLADFINAQGLLREGGNLFSATRDSGAAILGLAGTGRLGTIAGSTLENSNVDLTTEFVNMISTQKAFDANSKVITTADQVVQTALGMKR